MVLPRDPHNLSLFPYRETLEEVTEEAIASLPITTHNELIALLEIQRNTIAYLAAKG